MRSKNDEIRRPVLNFEVKDPGRGGTWAGMTEKGFVRRKPGAFPPSR